MEKMEGVLQRIREGKILVQNQQKQAAEEKLKAEAKKSGSSNS